MRALSIVLTVVAGCAPAFQTVPEHDWQLGVPTAQRNAIDHSYEVALARTQAELAAATVTHGQARIAATRPAVAIAADDPWANTMRTYERNEADARVRAETAQGQWRAADQHYRAERIGYLTVELVELRAAHELDRARAIDRRTYVGDSYETGAYQEQLARVQTPWFAAQARMEVAQAALQRATAQLAAAKESYAALVRTGPALPTSADVLRLTDWTPVMRGRWHTRATDRNYLIAPTLVAGR